MSSDQRAAKMQERWKTIMGGECNFGVLTLDEEKALDPDSVGTRGGVTQSRPSLPIKGTD
jgi:hypothetical protein